MRIGKLFSSLQSNSECFPRSRFRTRVMTDFLRDIYSIQFNIVSKGLGSERMSFYLNEAAGDIRDLLLPGIEGPKAKL